MGGSTKRMADFAELIARRIGHKTTDVKQLNMSRTDRFSFYKIGPVISVSVSMYLCLLFCFCFCFLCLASLLTRA